MEKKTLDKYVGKHVVVYMRNHVVDAGKLHKKRGLYWCDKKGEKRRIKHYPNEILSIERLELKNE